MANSFPATATLTEGTCTNGGTRAFGAVSTLAGDLVVVEVIFEGNPSNTSTLYTCTATGLTFAQTNFAAHTSLNSHTIVIHFTATDAVGASRTISIGQSSGTSMNCAARVTVVRGHNGVGGKAINTAGQTVSLARTGDNSTVFTSVGDWSTGAVGSPTWTPGGSTTQSQQGASATYIFGRWDDSGTAATASTGISSPSYTTPSMATLEILTQSTAVDIPAPPNVAAPGFNSPNGIFQNIPPITDSGTSNIDMSAEVTTHDVATGDATPSIGAPDAVAPANAHTTSDVTTTQTTTDGTNPTTTHTTAQPAPAIAVAAADTVTTHTTFDATVSTAVLVNVNAELTNHTVVAGDPTLSITTQADIANHTQVASDATPALGGTSGQGTTSHTTSDALTGLAAPDPTAPTTTHTTGDPAPTITINAADTVTTHTTYDATVSNAVLVNANAELTQHTLVVGDPTTTITTNAGAGATTHQTFDATASTTASATDVTNPANTHTTNTAVAGVGYTPQNASNAHTTSDVTSTQTTQAEAPSVAHTAFDAIVLTALPLAIYVSLDGSATAPSLDAPIAAGPIADATSTSAGMRDADARIATLDSATSASGSVS